MMPNYTISKCVIVYHFNYTQANRIHSKTPVIVLYIVPLDFLVVENLQYFKFTTANGSG